MNNPLFMRKYRGRQRKDSPIIERSFLGPWGRNKYHARRTRLDGHVFDSAAEARRYITLRCLRDTGAIFGLVVHPRFRLDVNGVHIADYVADFEYYTPEKERVVEDVKGMRLAVYRMKAKLMKAIHGIEIREVRA